MIRHKLSKNLRFGVVFLLILFIATAAYMDYESTVPHVVFAGYEVKSEMFFSTEGLLNAYPTGESKFIGYINYSKPTSFLGLSTYAYVRSSFLYNNASIVYNQTYYFVKLTKTIYLKFNVSNIYYDIYINTPYYTKLIAQNSTHNGVIPINIMSLCSQYNVLENETGVYMQPVFDVIINGSAIVNLSINGQVISVNLVKNTITQFIEESVYGKLVSLNEYPISQINLLYVYPSVYPEPLSENYSLILNISNFNYTVEQDSYHYPIVLNISQLYSIAKNFTSTYDLTPSTPIIYLNFSIKYNNFTFKPYIEITDNNGMIQVQASNNSLTSPVYRTINDPINYLDLIYVAFPTAILIYVLLFTQGVSPSPLAVIMKKYRKVIVNVNDPPPTEKRTIKVNNFGDLLKFSQFLAKPILANGNKLWISDEDSIYIYEI